MSRPVIYLTDSTDPYRNLAAEELLMDSDADDIILFLWQNENTIVIGRNQDAFAEVKVQEFLSSGGRIVRRNTGGGAVYHDTGNLNFSFIASEKNYDLERQLGVIAAALKKFGIEAEVSGRNDLTADGRKFSGNAFYDNGKMKLHHGTILIDTDPAKIAQYLTPDRRKLQKRNVGSVSSRVVCLNELCSGITVDCVRKAVAEAFAEEYGKGETMETVCLQDKGDSFPCLHELAASYASFDRIFGKKHGFTDSFEMDTGEGLCTVHYSSENGRITDAAVFTDSMDWNYADTLRRRLIGNTTEGVQ